MSVAIDAIEGPPGAAARWSSIDWPAVHRHVSRLQARIVKAIKDLVPGCFAAPYQGLSRVRSKSHARFLGEGEIVRSPPYPTDSGLSHCNIVVQCGEPAQKAANGRTRPKPWKRNF